MNSNTGAANEGFLAFLGLRCESVQVFACKTLMEKEQDGIVESLLFVPPLFGGEIAGNILLCSNLATAANS